MAIAIFDSGAGGLTVLEAAQKILPNENFIYFADTQHVPYGEKSSQKVKQYIQEAVDFLAQKNPQALVLACNTATSLMLEELRQKKYPFPILGMEPALKLAIDQLDKNLKNRILITGTSITVKGQRLKGLIDRFVRQAKFKTIALPQLVTMVEKNDFNEKRILDYLNSIIPKENFQAVVLGCTHFSFFSKYFKKILGHQCLVLDGNLGTANHLKNVLETKNKSLNLKKNKIDFYFSGKINPAKEKLYRKLLAKLSSH